MRPILNWEVLVFLEGGKPENPEENPRSKEENQQQTQSTYDGWSGNQTRDTLVGGERSHHCAIPAPYSKSSFILGWGEFMCVLHTEFPAYKVSFILWWVMRYFYTSNTAARVKISLLPPRRVYLNPLTKVKIKTFCYLIILQQVSTETFISGRKMMPRNVHLKQCAKI